MSINTSKPSSPNPNATGDSNTNPDSPDDTFHLVAATASIPPLDDRTIFSRMMAMALNAGRPDLFEEFRKRADGLAVPQVDSAAQLKADHCLFVDIDRHGGCSPSETLTDTDKGTQRMHGKTIAAIYVETVFDPEFCSATYFYGFGGAPITSAGNDETITGDINSLSFGLGDVADAYDASTHWWTGPANSL